MPPQAANPAASAENQGRNAGRFLIFQPPAHSAHPDGTGTSTHLSVHSTSCGGLRGALCGDDGAATCQMQPLTDGSGWFQMAPTAPPQGTAEPISGAGGAFGEMYLRKGKTLPQVGEV